jgi:hypothetical protein
MVAEDWTVLSEKPFDSAWNAGKYIAALKLEMSTNIIRFKVSEIAGKFYVLYKL